MRFFIMIKSVRGQDGPAAGCSDAGHRGDWRAEAPKPASLSTPAGFGPPSAGALVRVSGGKITVTDGPFAARRGSGRRLREFRNRLEGRGDQIGLRRFMELHVEHWPEWEGSAEVRPAFGPPKAG